MRANDKSNDEPLGSSEEGRGVSQPGNIPDESDALPLFLRDSSDGRKGDAQDEKDEATE
jgi:hypothetical protein